MRTRFAAGFAILAMGLLLALPIASPAAAQPAWSANPARTAGTTVEITLTPRDVSKGRLRVDVVLTVHSGDLSGLDLRTATELRVDGQTLRPVNAPALRGHHVRGRLEFALDRVPEAFEIVIRDVLGTGDLAFRWP